MTTDLETTRLNLIHMRTKYAGNLPVTMRISTLIEQLQEYETAGPEQRKMLDKLIEQSTAELAALTKGDGETP